MFLLLIFLKISKEKGTGNVAWSFIQGTNYFLISKKLELIVLWSLQPLSYVGRPAKTYGNAFCANSGFHQENLTKAIGTACKGASRESTLLARLRYDNNDSMNNLVFLVGSQNFHILMDFFLGCSRFTIHQRKNKNKYKLNSLKYNNIITFTFKDCIPATQDKIKLLGSQDILNPLYSSNPDIG